MIDRSLLRIYLNQLQLRTIKECYEDMSKKAESNLWSFLYALGDQKFASRQQRRIERHLLEAKVPIRKSLDRFEFHKLTSVTAAQMTSFAETTKWVNQVHTLILFGLSGVGKSHQSATIGRRLAAKEEKNLFSNPMTLVQKRQLAYEEKKLQNALDRLAKYDLLILDDFGYDKKLILRRVSYSSS